MTEQTIPGLSVLNPWAETIARRLKRIETRSWQTRYRGPLLIHAGLSTRYTVVSKRGSAERYYDYKTGLQVQLDAGLPHDCTYHYGALIAVAELVECRRITAWEPGRSIGGGALGFNTIKLTEQDLALGNYEPGRYAWVLGNVRQLPEPIPFKGAQGLFNVPVDILPAEFRPEACRG